MLTKIDYRSIVIIAVVLAGIIVLTPLALRIYEIKKFHHYTDRIEKAIEQMAQMRPPQTKQEIWDEACNGLLTANANICYSPEHVPTSKVVVLSERFETKVAGAANLETIEWMWDEFAAASPHGAYYAKYRRAFYLTLVESRQPELLSDAMRGQLSAMRDSWQAAGHHIP